MVACIRTLKVALLTYICPPLKAAPLEPLKAALFFAEASHRIASFLKFRPAKGGGAKGLRFCLNFRDTKGCAPAPTKGCAPRPRTMPGWPNHVQLELKLSASREQSMLDQRIRSFRQATGNRVTTRGRGGRLGKTKENPPSPSSFGSPLPLRAQ